MWLLVGLAWADKPFPDYDEAVVLRTWDKLDSLLEAACSGPPGPGRSCVPEPLREAIQRGEAFERHVTEDARIRYLIGLAHTSLGEASLARARFEEAVVLDPDRADAWHDLGEIRLAEGDLEGAHVAFEHVARLVERGPGAWLGPWRLAEVAALRQDADAFETHMRKALERGFTFRTIAGLPNWKRFAADPVIGPSVRKLITVYGTPEILESLEDL